MAVKRLNFTPGRWFITPDIENDRLVIETHDFTDVAIVPSPVPLTTEDNQTDYSHTAVANARLIAKAPVMYQMLKRIQQQIVTEHLMNKYVTGEESRSTAKLAKEITKLLRQIESGEGTAMPNADVYE